MTSAAFSCLALTQIVLFYVCIAPDGDPRWSYSPMNGVLWRTKMGWVNGSVQWYPTNSVAGHVILFSTDYIPPYEPYLREVSAKGASAAVFMFKSTTYLTPGFSMYQVDGQERKSIHIPVFEVVFGLPGTLLLPTLPNGSWISVRPSYYSPWKGVADSPFQLIWNLILSFMEIAIIVIAVLRLRQFYIASEIDGQPLGLFSPALLCTSFECVGALLRLAYTCVDPFESYRLLPYSVATIGTTISLPFTLSAGIVLTFFCTSNLMRSGYDP